jgi:hypothetical protein
MALPEPPVLVALERFWAERVERVAQVYLLGRTLLPQTVVVRAGAGVVALLLLGRHSLVGMAELRM